MWFFFRSVFPSTHIVRLTVHRSLPGSTCGPIFITHSLASMCVCFFYHVRYVKKLLVGHGSSVCPRGVCLPYYSGLLDGFDGVCGMDFSKKGFQHPPSASLCVRLLIVQYVRNRCLLDRWAVHESNYKKTRQSIAHRVHLWTVQLICLFMGLGCLFFGSVGCFLWDVWYGITRQWQRKHIHLTS